MILYGQTSRENQRPSPSGFHQNDPDKDISCVQYPRKFFTAAAPRTSQSSQLLSDNSLQGKLVTVNRRSKHYRAWRRCF
jgi:hypothetical protein